MKKKKKEEISILLSPLHLWYNRLALSLETHPAVAAWCLDELYDIARKDMIRFDTIFKHR
tara:strand:- start:98 stop:277 length:180 start_codon:yes stop_codon:yes gene_type:complete